MNNDLNTTPQSTPTTTRLNSLDENINAAIDEIMWSELPVDQWQIKKRLFNIIKQNIEGNVNWKVG